MKTGTQTSVAILPRIPEEAVEVVFDIKHLLAHSRARFRTSEDSSEILLMNSVKSKGYASTACILDRTNISATNCTALMRTSICSACQWWLKLVNQKKNYKSMTR